MSSIDRLRRAVAAMSGSDGRNIHQQQYLENCLGVLNAGQIGLCEASTGVGKTRAGVEALVRHQNENKGCKAGIAVHSVAAIRHFADEYLRLRESGFNSGKKRWTVLLGRQNFVDSSMLELLMLSGDLNLSEESVDRLEEWLDGGGKVLENGPSAGIAKICPKVAYLLDDALAVAPELDEIAPAITLGSGYPVVDRENCRSLRVYDSLRQDALEGATDLLLCTHAMVAHDAKMRRIRLSKTEENGDEDAEVAGLIADIPYWLIDEAHLLEHAFVMVDTHTFSPLTLLATINKLQTDNRSQESKIATVADMCRNLLRYSKTLDPQREVYAANHWAEKLVPFEVLRAYEHLKNLHESLLELKKALPMAPLAGISTSIARILARRQSSGFSISPVRHFPSFITGPFSVSDNIATFWDRTTAAVLMSATLLLPTRGGSPDAGHILSQLGIPASRASCPTPITPAWVTGPVTLHVPERPSAWKPPAEKEGDDEQEYAFLAEEFYESVTNLLVNVVRDAQWGTLVLCTSYESVTELHNRLAKNAPDLLVLAHSRNDSVMRLREAFISLSAGGLRPIWLATGSAWTGLDLTEPDRTKPDNVLENLVITRVPFRSPGSSMRKHGGKNDAAFMFRQGLGRLVRRPDATGKHLWVVDGRIWSGARIYDTFLAILAKYNTVKFDSPAISAKKTKKGSRLLVKKAETVGHPAV